MNRDPTLLYLTRLHARQLHPLTHLEAGSIMDIVPIALLSKNVEAMNLAGQASESPAASLRSTI